MFNGFVVCNISEDEAVFRVRVHFYAPHFLPLYTENQDPVVLYLEREGRHSRLDFSGIPDELDPSISSRDTRPSTESTRDIEIDELDPARMFSLRGVGCPNLAR